MRVETEQTRLVLKYFRQTNKDLFSVILQRNPWRSNIVCQQKNKFKGFYVISDLWSSTLPPKTYRPSMVLLKEVELACFAL